MPLEALYQFPHTRVRIRVLALLAQIELFRTLDSVWDSGCEVSSVEFSFVEVRNVAAKPTKGFLLANILMALLKVK